VIISRAPVSYRADGVSGYGWLLVPSALVSHCRMLTMSDRLAPGTGLKIEPW